MTLSQHEKSHLTSNNSDFVSHFAYKFARPFSLLSLVQIPLHLLVAKSTAKRALKTIVKKVTTMKASQPSPTESRQAKKMEKFQFHLNDDFPEIYFDCFPSSNSLRHPRERQWQRQLLPSSYRLFYTHFCTRALFSHLIQLKNCVWSLVRGNGTRRRIVKIYFISLLRALSRCRHRHRTALRWEFQSVFITPLSPTLNHPSSHIQSAVSTSREKLKWK